MDEIHTSNSHFLTLGTDDGQTELAEYPQGVTATQAINMSISHPDLTYQTGISLEGVKQENEGRLQSNSNLPIKAHMQVIASDLLTTGVTNEAHKIVGGQSSYIPVAQTMNVNSSAITLGNIETLGSSGIPISTSSGNMQSVPVFQQGSFENCDTVLRQQPTTNQTFLIASPGSVLSSNAMHSSDELVYLPTSAANSSVYTMANSDMQFVSAIPVIQSSSTQPARLILQGGSTNTTSHQVLSNNGSIFLQMGNNTMPAPAHMKGTSISNQGHIVIKSGSTKTKPQPEVTNNERVLKIMVREGSTTKVTPPIPPVSFVSGEDVLRKHVQVNLTNKNTKLLYCEPSSFQATSSAIEQNYQREGTIAHKLYTCPNCDIQFLKSLNLRQHKRECKKPESKPEKIPSYMCAFCKLVFKTSSQVYSHFINCTEHPSYGGKDKIKVGKNTEMQKKLDFPILFKCQDCERTFSKERQYTSHLRRCSEVNFIDLSGSKVEAGGEENADGLVDNVEDPFADPPSSSSRRGRGNSGGRRGRPPGRAAATARSSAKSNILFEGASVPESTPGLVVLDNENLVRSTVGLAHTLNLTLDMAMSEGKPRPNALVTDPKGVKGKNKPPQAWSLICSLCQKMFIAKEALACHIVEQHGTDLLAAKDVLLGNVPQVQTLYRCPLCILNFQSEDNVVEHLVLRHTGRLQECYSDLQNQTGTFVCSLCSIVLLTKNLLIEHMSLEHLDELLIGSNKAKANENRLKEAAPPVLTDNEDSWDDDISAATPVNNNCKLPALNEENPAECCFCADIFPDVHKLHNHYITCHDMETDAEGRIVDNGIDVDIRVKDTQNLLLIAGSKMAEGTPEKTVLIRKKTKKPFMAICHTCHKSFNRQELYYRHVQEGCISSSSDGCKALSSTEKNFFCRVKECSHLVFNQVKILFKHMYDVHGITVPKERKTFRNLQYFHQWLEGHSKERNIKFVNENSTIEKGAASLTQMICEKFYSSRANQAKEKEADLSKPTKKRLSVRAQRSDDCYARIHLRTEYNSGTGMYDGETQMIYYPEHSHLKEELNEPDKTDELRLKRKRNGAVSEEDASILSLDLDQELTSISERPHNTKDLPTAYDNNLMCFTTQNGSSNFDFSSPGAVTTSNVLMVESEAKKSKQAFIVQPTNTSSLTSGMLHQNQVILQPNSLQSSAMLVPGGNTILVHNSDLTSQGMESADTNKSILIENNDNNSFIVQDNMIMNMNHDQGQPDESQDYADEFVLPADANEWTKLFRLLRDRLQANQLNDDDKKEGESILPYENVITAIAVHDQASIFQKLCTITGTSVQTPP